MDATDGVFLAVTAGPGAETADGTSIPAGQVIAVSRVAILTASEAWLEGIRVDPLVRGLGIATDLQVAELRWAAAHGASVMRYLTGEQNEGSHRLGAKHGFVAPRARPEAYGWDHDRSRHPPSTSRSRSRRIHRRHPRRFASRRLVVRGLRGRHSDRRSSPL